MTDWINDNLVDLKQALLVALKNIKNCYNTGIFTNNSLQNFKKSKLDSYLVLEKEVSQEITTKEEWFIFVLGMAASFDDEEVNNTAKEIIKACSKKDRQLYDSLFPGEKVDNDKSKNKESNHEKIKTPKPKDEEPTRILKKNDSGEKTLNKKKEDGRNEINGNENTSEKSSVERNRNSSINEHQTMENMMKVLKDLAISQTITRRLRLDSFKNSNQDAQEWFNKFERQTAKWPYDEKGYEVAAWFEETALKHWEMMPEEKKYDYDEIKKLMLKKFRAVDYIFEAKTKFYSMKQETNEKVEDFVYRIHKCKNDWPQHEHRLFEKDVCKIFKKGLKPEIAKQFVSNEDENLQELIQQARRLEGILKKESESRLEEAAISVEASISNNRIIKCFKCGQTGHISSKCTNAKKQDTAENDAKIFCMFCGRNNHFAVNCKIMKAHQNRFFFKADNKDNWNEKKKQWCKHCKMNNHSTEKCRNKGKTNMKCFKCEKLGHRASECKEKLNE